MECLFGGEEHQVLQVSQDNSERMVYVGSQPSKVYEVCLVCRMLFCTMEASAALVFICVWGGEDTGIFSSKKQYKMPSSSGDILDSSWEEKETMELCLNANYREES